MKKLPLALILAIGACTAALTAQTYRATYAAPLLLSGGGSPIKPLTIQAPTLSAPYTLTFPGDDGAANQFLQTDGSGNLVWASSSSGLLPLSSTMSSASILLDLTNTGTGDVAQFEINNASNTGNALTAITNGTGLAILANGGVQVSNGNLTLANTGTAGQLRLHEAGGPDYTAFEAQDQSGNNITYTLPAVNGTSGQFLTVASSPAPTSTAATLQWSTVSGTVSRNATLVGDGSSGSPLGINLANSNTWTANQTFAGTFLITSNSRIALTNSDNNPRDVRWQEPSGTGSQYIGIRAPSVTNNGNYVWPAVVGSVGQVMSIATSNGIDSATMQWTTPVTGLTLPYTQSASDAGTLFALTNTDGTTGGTGSFEINNASNSGAALTATTNGTGPAISSGGNLQFTTAGSKILNSAGEVTVDDNMVVTGASDLQGMIGNTMGDLQLTDNVDISGDLDVGAGNFTVAASTGNTHIGGTLNAAGAISNSAGNVTVEDNLVLSNSGTASELRLNEPSGSGSEYTAFTAQAQANNITYTLPATNGSAGQVLAVASSPAPTSTTASLEWASGGGLSTVTHNATLTGNGTVGSPLGINLGNANTWTANQTFAGTFLITSNARIAMTNSDNNARDLRMQEPSGTGTQYIGIRAPSVTNNGNYLLPAVVGTAGQVLSIQSSNNGAGTGLMDSATLVWSTVSGGGTATVDSTLIGDGSGGSPLGLDLAQVNVWTATITSFLGFLEVRNEPLVITNTDNSANEIRIQEASGNGSNYVAFRADTSISTNDVWILPSTAGTAGQVLGITAVNTPSNRFYTLDWKSPSSSAAYSYTTYSANANLATTDELVGATTSGGAFTLTLPAANSVSAGKFYIINNESSPAGNNLTIARSGTDLIDGGTSTVISGALVGSSGAIIYSNGVNAWYRVP